MKLALRVVSAALALVASGCMPQHVSIALPARDAAMPERVAAYRNYRAGSTITMISQDDKSETLKLGNGEYVTYVEDLLPAVEPDSKTAEQIQIASDYRTPSDALSATTTLSLVGYIVSIFAYGFTDSDTYAKPLPLTLIGVSLGSFLVNGLWLQPTVTDARTKAFDLYDDDLLQRLRLQRKDRVEDAAAHP